VGRSWLENALGKICQNLSEKETKAKMTGGIAQVGEHKTLGSNPTTIKKLKLIKIIIKEEICLFASDK
jgi:hypothetical protein